MTIVWSNLTADIGAIACDNTFVDKDELGSHNNHSRLGVIILIHVMTGVTTLVLAATMELDNIRRRWTMWHGV